MPSHTRRTIGDTLGSEPDPAGIIFAGLVHRMTISSGNLEAEALSHMDRAGDLAAEFRTSLVAMRETEAALEETVAMVAENIRGQGEKMTETALKQAVSRDVRVVPLEAEAREADVRHECAKLALKMFWERGEMLKALLFSKNAEMKAMSVTNIATTNSTGIAAGAQGVSAQLRNKFKGVK